MRQTIRHFGVRASRRDDGGERAEDHADLVECDFHEVNVATETGAIIDRFYVRGGGKNSRTRMGGKGGKFAERDANCSGWTCALTAPNPAISGPRASSTLATESRRCWPARIKLPSVSPARCENRPSLPGRHSRGWIQRYPEHPVLSAPHARARISGETGPASGRVRDQASSKSFPAGAHPHDFHPVRDSRIHVRGKGARQVSKPARMRLSPMFPGSAAK